MPNRAVKAAITREALRTDIGTQDFDISGLGTPVAAIPFATANTTNNSVGAHALLSVGAGVSSANQGVVFTQFSDGLATGVQRHRARTAHILARYNATGNTISGTASLDATLPFSTDFTRLNVDDPTNALLTNVLMFAGANALPEHHIVTANAIAGQHTDVAIARRPTWFLVYTSEDDFTDIAGHAGHATHVIGFGSVDPDGTVHLVSQVMSWWHPTSTATGCFGYVSSNGIYTIDPTESIVSTDGRFAVGFPNDNTLRLTTVTPTGDGDPAQLGILMLNMGGLRARTGVTWLPAATGLQTILGPPFKSQKWLVGYSAMDAIDTFVAGSGAGVFGLGCVTRPKNVAAGAAEFSASVCAEHGAATSNSGEIASDDFIRLLAGDQSTDAVARLNAFIHGAAILDISDAPAVPRPLIYLALEQEDVLGNRADRRLGLNRLSPRVFGMKGVSIN